MKFKVLRRTASGNVVLSCDENVPLERKVRLVSGGRTVAVLLETVASVDSPLYLAKMLEEVKEGEILTPKEG